MHFTESMMREELMEKQSSNVQIIFNIGLIVNSTDRMNPFLPSKYHRGFTFVQFYSFVQFSNIH